MGHGWVCHSPLSGASKATWKIVAADMPIGLVVGDGTGPLLGCPRGENSSNGDGPVLGREFEIASILSFIKTKSVRTVQLKDATGTVIYSTDLLAE